MSKQYREQIRDKVKLAVINYAAKNPQWSPESLKATINFFMRHFGLRNRYLPPDFKADKKDDEPSQQPQPDHQRVERAAEPAVNGA